jgi:hypothetical protein
VVPEALGDYWHFFGLQTTVAVAVAVCVLLSVTVSVTEPFVLA